MIALSGYVYVGFMRRCIRRGVRVFVNFFLGGAAKDIYLLPQRQAAWLVALGRGGGGEELVCVFV